MIFNYWGIFNMRILHTVPPSVWTLSEKGMCPIHYSRVMSFFSLVISLFIPYLIPFDSSYHMQSHFTLNPIFKLIFLFIPYIVPFHFIPHLIYLICVSWKLTFSFVKIHSCQAWNEPNLLVSRLSDVPYDLHHLIIFSEVFIIYRNQHFIPWLRKGKSLQLHVLARIEKEGHNPNVRILNVSWHVVQSPRL